jgi:hypothetical protein
LEQWIESSINILLELLEHDHLTKGDSEFQTHHPTFGIESDNAQIVTAMTSDPSNTLQLWVNQKWPTRTRTDDSGVLKRHRIIW